MRTLARIHLLVIAAVFILVLLIRHQSSDRLSFKVATPEAVELRRLVVFGDFHSDNRHARELAQGLSWTKLLGQELLYDRIDYFAPSYETNSSGIETAALVDNELLVNLTGRNASGPIFTPLPDFRTQVEQWIEFEKDRLRKSHEIPAIEQTVFTVFFGTWDLWQITEMAYDNPMFALQESIFYLFDQLDVIADQLPNPPTILLFNMFDLTFTPRYQSQRLEHPASRTIFDAQRQTISLVKEWNQLMHLEAREWTRGHLILFDIDKWLIHQLRQVQLYDYHYRDMSLQDPSLMPLFNDTVSPCYNPEKPTPSNGVCETPREYLFWDDLQFGPTAHGLIAKEVAQLIYANNTMNAPARLKMLAQMSLQRSQNASAEGLPNHPSMKAAT